jgi:Rad3-related DNA helicase
MTIDLLETVFPDVSSPVWGSPGLPDWVQAFRPHQTDAIMAVLDCYERGADLVLLQAPTGSGKSLLAEAVRRLLGVKALYVPTTKQLQRQLSRDFPEAKVLMGRANYPTADHPEWFEDRWHPISAADCRMQREFLPACDSCDHVTEKEVPHCTYCHPISACSYQQAKWAALDADLAIVNAAYFITEANGPGRFTEREFVILDEADALENILVDHCECHISERRRVQLGLDLPPLKTVESSWLPWLMGEAIPKVQAARKQYMNSTELKGLRDYAFFSQLGQRLDRLVGLLEEGNAIYDGYQRGDITFRPIRVDHTAPDMLWRHSKRWLLMSATLIPDELVQTLGIEEAGLHWEVVNVPSTFPVENRPIIVRNVANMVFKEKGTEWPKMVHGICRVIDRYPGERVLIHTVSYDFTAYLFDHLRLLNRPVVVYGSAREREEALRIYSETPGAVLLAPSMERGVDLLEDLCRAVIVAKVPWLSTRDKRVQQRVYSRGGQLWYVTNAIRSLIQATGRGVRSESDHADAWILDAQFTNNLWKKHKGLFPKWWTEALDFSGGGL